MVLLTLTLESCGTVPVTIPEETFYTDAGADGAVVTHYYDPTISFMGKAAWDNIREGMTCEQGQTFADWKKQLEDFCSQVTCNKSTPIQALRDYLDRQIKVHKQHAIEKEVNDLIMDTSTVTLEKHP